MISRRGSGPRFTTTATGRCSTAPADARHTAAVTRTALRSGRTTPVAPAPSALRQTAPRLCGSVTPSRQTSSGRSAGGELVGVGIAVGLAEGDDTLMISAFPRPRVAQPRERSWTRRPLRVPQPWLGDERPLATRAARAPRAGPPGAPPVPDGGRRRARVARSRERHELVAVERCLATSQPSRPISSRSAIGAAKSSSVRAVCARPRRDGAWRVSHGGHVGACAVAVTASA